MKVEKKRVTNNREENGEDGWNASLSDLLGEGMVEKRMTNLTHR